MQTLRLDRFACALLLTLVAGGPPALGQQGDPAAELHQRVSNFFLDLDTLGAEQALQGLLVQSPLNNNDSIQKLQEKVAGFDERYGKFVQSERVSARTVGQDLVLMRYLYKATRYPVVWYFTFYRPPTTADEPRMWILVSLRFDTNLELLAFGDN